MLANVNIKPCIQSTDKWSERKWKGEHSICNNTSPMRYLLKTAQTSLRNNSTFRAIVPPDLCVYAPVSLRTSILTCTVYFNWAHQIFASDTLRETRLVISSIRGVLTFFTEGQIVKNWIPRRGATCPGTYRFHQNSLLFVNLKLHMIDLVGQLCFH